MLSRQNAVHLSSSNTVNSPDAIGSSIRTSALSSRLRGPVTLRSAGASSSTTRSTFNSPPLSSRVAASVGSNGSSLSLRGVTTLPIIGGAFHSVVPRPRSDATAVAEPSIPSTSLSDASCSTVSEESMVLDMPFEYTDTLDTLRNLRPEVFSVDDPSRPVNTTNLIVRPSRLEPISQSHAVRLVSSLPVRDDVFSPTTTNSCPVIFGSRYGYFPSAGMARSFQPISGLLTAATSDTASAEAPLASAPVHSEQTVTHQITLSARL